MEVTMSEKKVITTDKAPKPIGPYSAGILYDPFVFTAGQAGIDPATGKVVSGGIEAETRQVMHNLQNILIEAGTSMDNVIKTTVFLRDMNDFPRMNAIYGEFFKEKPPARSTIQAAALPMGVAVEIEVIAVKK
jgi:2-iminobutanoate/2-iminopropanoate deaminase